MFRESSVGFLLIISGMVFCSTMDSAAANNVQSQPNIVMIISDDHRWNDYGFMGHPVVRTPHLDQLASRSAVFRRGYVPMALCRPSLMTMITGLYPYQHGITGNDPHQQGAASNAEFAKLKLQMIEQIRRCPSIPRSLGDRGYLSHQSGKWWEGSFENGGFTHGMTRGFPEHGGRHGDDGLTIGREGMAPVRDFIDTASAAGQPFFVWYAPFLPHAPHNPPARLLEKYQAPDRPIEIARYYAMIEWFDETCGELISHLEQKKLIDNTLIVYCCDNGWVQTTPSMQLPDQWKNGFAPRSKQSPYDGGVRTPILFSWPGVIPPADRPEVISTIDLLPTILAAAETRSSSPTPGINLLPIMQNQKELDREFIYGESYGHDVVDQKQLDESLWFRWCIEDRWKLILSYPDTKGRYGEVQQAHAAGPQLFDLLADPDEQQNLAAQFPEVVQQLRLRIDSVRTTDKQPLD